MEQTKEDLIEKCSEYLKKMWPLITATLFPITEWVIKLHFSQEAESKYGIPEKYFFSYNYRKNIYISILFLLYVISFFLITKISKRENKLYLIFNGIIQFIFILLPTVILSLLISNRYGWNLKIIIFILSLLNIVLIILYNFFIKSKLMFNIVSLVFILYFFGILFWLNITIYQNKNYEFTTIILKNNKEENFVVLSEYEDKYLIVPYLKKNDNYNGKKSKCKNEYCFFTKYYKFIDKNEYIFSSEIIKTENIYIEKEGIID